MISNNNAAVCPRCHHPFPPQLDFNSFMNHVRECQGQQANNLPKLPKQKQKKNKQQFFYEKVPVNPNHLTKFRWEKRIKNIVDYNKIAALTAKDAANGKLTFQEKQAWFRTKLEATRINWQQGADYMNIDRQNILISSLNEVKNVNLLKEVKINFKGDKVNDAGGLLRQWIFMVIKEIFNINTGIFTFAKTEDITYKLKWDEQIDQVFSKELLCLLGIIIAKAIFERIPINCYLDRTILRQLSGQQLKLDDIYGHDEELYKNWNYLLNSPNAQQLETYFTLLSHTGQTLKQIEILPDGKQTLVTDDNKALYVELCMQMLVGDKVYRSINAIKQGIQYVFPCSHLLVFQPYEIQMLLYGVPFIELQDWHDNTEYQEPYHKNHAVIKWFWNTMQNYDQEQLGKILHFCTGSSRTPINGFSKLQSNRGNYSKFLIVSTKFEIKNPYPKGHTCFNRLELPMYPNEELLKLYLTSISKNELDGIFGLD